LKSTHGVDVYFAPSCVSDKDAVNKTIGKLIEQLGSVDILINNAGTAKFGTVLVIFTDRFPFHFEIWDVLKIKDDLFPAQSPVQITVAGLLLQMLVMT
jgi:NAD(P)-dependent dehydrogenase (short-subunit alcohol dehydrogenase family)